jgi:hypothetical protein
MHIRRRPAGRRQQSIGLLGKRGRTRLPPGSLALAHSQFPRQWPVASDHLGPVSPIIIGTLPWHVLPLASLNPLATDKTQCPHPNKRSNGDTQQSKPFLLENTSLGRQGETKGARNYPRPGWLPRRETGLTLDGQPTRATLTTV